MTLGGEVGRALISGFPGKLAWLSAFVVGMALVAPGPTLAFARHAPLWLQEAWDRRWPHKVAGAVGRLLAFAFRRPGMSAESEIVIGAGSLPALSTAAAIEEGPIIFRPSIDPASPSSPLGTGAAAVFARPGDCTGCAICAECCPDVCIEVWR